MPSLILHTAGAHCFDDVGLRYDEDRNRNQHHNDLRRGGRISAVAATVGTMLDLKPIITEGRNGKLLSTDKVRGRRQALRTLAELAAQNIDDPAEAEMYVLHADAPEDADRLVQLLREKIPGLGNISTRYVGPVIGAHCGPGTVAVCFFGKERPY